ncbi:partitioning defective protein 6 [Pelomyxa schiedti]|nr:partitioning defective protein 6 [Pelomyxa schiedti]
MQATHMAEELTMSQKIAELCQDVAILRHALSVHSTMNNTDFVTSDTVPPSSLIQPEQHHSQDLQFSLYTASRAATEMIVSPESSSCGTSPSLSDSSRSPHKHWPNCDVEFYGTYTEKRNATARHLQFESSSKEISAPPAQHPVVHSGTKRARKYTSQSFLYSEETAKQTPTESQHSLPAITTPTTHAVQKARRFSRRELLLIKSIHIHKRQLIIKMGKMQTKKQQTLQELTEDQHKGPQEIVPPSNEIDDQGAAQQSTVGSSAESPAPASGTRAFTNKRVWILQNTADDSTSARPPCPKHFRASQHSHNNSTEVRNLKDPSHAYRSNNHATPFPIEQSSYRTPHRNVSRVFINDSKPSSCSSSSKQSRKAANDSLRKSVRRTKKECSFFNLGKCTAPNCKFAHNPLKVRICKQFLAGKVCADPECKLRHEADPHMMPACSFFLKGCCVRTNCPFLHVKLPVTTPACADFLAGFCPRGADCDLQHSFICVEWLCTGSCTQPECKLRHQLLLSKHPTSGGTDSEAEESDKNNSTTDPYSFSPSPVPEATADDEADEQGTLHTGVPPSPSPSPYPSLLSLLV